MIHRRSVLAWLGMGPAVAPVALEAAASGATIGPAAYPGDYLPDAPEEAPPPDPMQKILNRMCRDWEDGDTLSHYAEIPEHIASKKSWSPAFKRSETQKEFRVARKKEKAISGIFWSDRLTPAEKLMKLAKLGIHPQEED